MDSVFIILALLVGIPAGPVIVAKTWPKRSRCVGDQTAGECGASPIFWGTALGLAPFVFVTAALILSGPEQTGNMVTRIEIAAGVVALLAFLAGPFIVWGFHSWKWNSEGLEFIGVFRRQTIRWSDISSIKRFKQTGWTFKETGGKRLSIADGYVPDQSLIIGALSVYRPDMAPQIVSSLQDESA